VKAGYSAGDVAGRHIVKGGLRTRWGDLTSRPTQTLAYADAKLNLRDRSELTAGAMRGFEAE
jgi:hypothetical protein